MDELRKVISTLHQLYSGVHDVSALNKTGSDGDSQSCNDMLCHTGLGELHSAEQDYTTALAEFTEKRFFDVSS